MYDANKDRNSVIVNKLIQPIEGRFIRIYPETWYGHMSMRMELYGCEIQSGEKALLCLWYNQIFIIEKEYKQMKDHRTYALSLSS